MKTFTMIAITLLLSVTALAGCEKQGPLEKAGESVDEAVTDAGNAVEDACENVKEGVNAKDTDC